MKNITKFFFLSPKDIGIQKLDIKDIVEIMKPTTDVIDGPKEFADTIYEIFEKKKAEDMGNHIPNKKIKRTHDS